MLEALLVPTIAVSGPVLTALTMEALRRLRLRRWRRDNLPIPYLPADETGILSAQPAAGPGHSMARVS